MITFNHERFILQAVESALAQRTDFDFELVIGDDASTDGTRELLLPLANCWRDRVQLILHPSNVGMQANLAQVLARCRGQYIALLEGDDYWTDPEKLSLQVELLDRQREVAICHHNALAIDDQDRAPPRLWHAQPQPQRSTLESLLDGNTIVTCTVMFRHRLFDKLPEWYVECPIADWPLHVLNARFGEIAYLDRAMAVYRLHAGGVWSPRPRREIIERTIATARLLPDMLTARQRRRLNRTIERWQGDVVELLLADRQMDEAQDYGQQHLGSGGTARLISFHRGQACELAGRRWSAAGHYLRAAVSGWRRTRITWSDLLLAFCRVVCPPIYRAARYAWRTAQPRGAIAGSPAVRKLPSDRLESRI